LKIKLLRGNEVEVEGVSAVGYIKKNSIDSGPFLG
jgi:hypothetical protein